VHKYIPTNVLFIIAKRWKLPKFPPTARWINNFLYIHLKGNVIQPWKRKLNIINKKSVRRRKRRIEGIKVRGNEGKRKQKGKIRYHKE
jgi:hypothetical protein